MIFGNGKELDDLINQYAEKFKRNFPMFMMMGTPDAELIKIIRNALDTGIAFEPPDDDPEIDY